MMNFKRIMIDCVVVAACFVLFILWYQNYIKKDDRLTASLMKYNTVYLITPIVNPYFEMINQGATKMAAATGVNYIWAVPSERSAAKQIETINNAVNDGANVLMISADDPRRISGAIEDAKARGVKIIYVDTPANEEAIITLSTNNIEAGELAGRTMITELENQGNMNGSIGIISIKSKQNSDLRELGFRKIIEADGKYTVLDTVYTNGEPASSMEATKKVINETMDLVGLFATTTGITEGVGKAIQADNNRITGIGFDKTETNLELIHNGSLKAIVVQNPFTMGYLGMAEAVTAISGKDTGPSYLDTGITVFK